MLKKGEKEDLCEVRNDKDRWKETGRCDVIRFLHELSETRRRVITAGDSLKNTSETHTKDFISANQQSDLPHMEKGNKS